jgi:DNA invertase Pin-like site-specific DNA recombinase
VKAAIYARYSSENQRPESIEDQILACRKLARERDLQIDDQHIYADRAASGARKDRRGLNALLAASESGQFGVVIVDDLSRLARDNYLMLSILAELRFRGVEVISVADGLTTDDEECMLGIQVRGIFNELQLRDLRKKTLRGQLGQKQRGFAVGERTFGYRSVPVGEMRMDKKGRPRPDGYKMEIDPVEAATVVQIFSKFADGVSLTRIVKRLNEEQIPGSSRMTKGWSPSTITRMLANEKYTGRWVWNRTETRRDPKTGRRRRFPKPESEWVISEDDSLRIIPTSLWDQVQKRREEIQQNWPGQAGKRGFEVRRRARVAVYPTQLFSGAMTCGTCGKSILQVSGKAGGYYGCLSATKGGCDNRLLVRRTLLERVLIDALRERVLCRENLVYVSRRIEKEISRVYADVPEVLRLKQIELSALDRRIANFVEFIGEGRGSQALASALNRAEKEATALRAEIDGLSRSREAMFQPPPEAWVTERLVTLQAVLERKTERAALTLRRILGPIVLEPVRPQVGRPYYRARSSLNALAILEPEEEPAPEAGPSVLRKWRRGELNPYPRATTGYHGTKNRALSNWRYPALAHRIPRFCHPVTSPHQAQKDTVNGLPKDRGTDEAGPSSRTTDAPDRCSRYEHAAPFDPFPWPSVASAEEGQPRSCSSAFASMRSRVSMPSVNQA